MNRILELLCEKWPRAIVLVNDPVAVGAMKRMEEEGLRVPDDIAKAGFRYSHRSVEVSAYYCETVN